MRHVRLSYPTERRPTRISRTAADRSAVTVPGLCCRAPDPPPRRDLDGRPRGSPGRTGVVLVVRPPDSTYVHSSHMEERDAPERLFTLEEANALVPRVRVLLERVRERAAELGALQERLEGFRERKRRGDHAAEGEARLAAQALGEANRLSTEIRDLALEVEAMGVEVKDLRTGLVDFRTRRDGRVVYLCWRLGEDEIRYWHELDTGFAGREPL